MVIRVTTLKQRPVVKEKFLRVPGTRPVAIHAIT